MGDMTLMATQNLITLTFLSQEMDIKVKHHDMMLKQMVSAITVENDFLKSFFMTNAKLTEEFSILSNELKKTQEELKHTKELLQKQQENFTLELRFIKERLNDK